jgi:hypothetical protein
MVGKTDIEKCHRYGGMDISENKSLASFEGGDARFLI